MQKKRPQTLRVSFVALAFTKIAVILSLVTWTSALGQARRAGTCFFALILTSEAFAAETGLSRSDAADTYSNPIIAADFSDPDVIATPTGFWMTASSFNSSPALPLLFSEDLVRWRLVGHALQRNQPETWFSQPQHGNGVWAPCLRFHDGRFWIFFPDPDHGIWVTSTDDPLGTWSTPRLILAGQGLIDPTPLWDQDGRAWLLHGWAKSRAGFNNRLTLHEMAPDASWVATEGRTLIDGDQLSDVRTLEGPKFYYRDGYYWIFAPQGGVTAGTQLVFRSEKLEGPWAYRTVLAQGDTDVNGPHQGAWVRTSVGEDWFIHFQSRPPFGRIVHLQPMQWRDQWPVIGSDTDHDGIGEPVSTWLRPAVSRPTGRSTELSDFSASDDFSSPEWHPAWHWNTNPEVDWARRRSGRLILNSQPNGGNLWQQPALLLQRLPAQSMIAETVIDVPDRAMGWRGGLLVYGEDYAWIGLRGGDQGEVMLGIGRCRDARIGCEETFEPLFEVGEAQVRVRVNVSHLGHYVFSTLINDRWHSIGELMTARNGRWVGAKIGLFAAHNEGEQSVALSFDAFGLSPTETASILATPQ